MSISPDELRERIRTVPNWPVDGVQFRDITPVLADGDAFRRLIAELHARHAADPPDGVAAVDARGFIIGGALACALGVGFVPVRKRGKLPYRTLAEDYALEYGSGTLEVHGTASSPARRCCWWTIWLPPAARCWPLPACSSASARR